MTEPGTGMRIGLIEPHLLRFGGIRRMVEFSNRLVDRGHHVTIYLPDEVDQTCRWMPCTAQVKPLSVGYDDPIDVLIFNQESQWDQLDRFTAARRRVFYALHYARLYDKRGSWDCLRVPVDAQFANSSWTADMIEAEIGHRPTVVLGGANRDMFRPHGGPKRYPLLCTGDSRPWKGTELIEAAAVKAGLPLERYAGKNLSQEALGQEYDAAEVFVVGSEFEGFCQPGLEALACGVPLVTTDNGGCREYAIDEETALVVPSGDVDAMAEAIRRLHGDRMLQRRLSRAGLDLVEQSFDWERRTDTLVEILDGVVAGKTTAPPPRPAVPEHPDLSIVVLTWDNLNYSQDFVESVRQRTDVPYELIIVDNGSEDDAAHYAAVAADTAVLNDHNRGFSVGMNQGAAAASGEWIAFCNNDTILPQGWASKLLETGRAHPDAGIVVPALTNARNTDTVRDTPGDRIVTMRPFSAPPAAVVYLMRAEVVDALGGWGEEYEIASGEDVDLAFKVWANGLDIIYDERVLVDHVGKGTASRLDDWVGLWARNRQRFLDKWRDPASDVPRLERCAPQDFERNRQIASAAAEWMDRYFRARDRAEAAYTGRLGARVRTRIDAQARILVRRTRQATPAALRGKLYRAVETLPDPVSTRAMRLRNRLR